MRSNPLEKCALAFCGWSVFLCAQVADAREWPAGWKLLAEANVGPGLDYACAAFEHPAPEVHQRVHFLRVHPEHGWRIELSPLPQKPGSRATLAEQANKRLAAAAINGTFFDMSTYVSTCTLRIGGVTLVANKHPDEFREFGALVLDTAGHPALLAKGAQDWTNVYKYPDLMAAGPVLLNGSAPYSQNRNPHDRMRHARTVVALADDGACWFAAVDGYEAEASGMTYAEAGTLMKSLGCRDALNLDGGASTGMWIRHPSQAHWSRRPGFHRLDYPAALPNAVLIVPAERKAWDGRGP